MPGYRQRIRGYFHNEMRYINLRFTNLLTERESVIEENERWTMSVCGEVQ